MASSLFDPGARRALVVLAIALRGTTAMATPVDDVRAGTALLLTQSYVHTEGGVFGLDDQWVSKAPGTLDVTVAAASLGFDVPDDIALTGTARGDRLTWTFDHTLATPYDVPDTGIIPTHIESVRGTVVLQARYIPGDADARCWAAVCPYNVALEMVSSEIHLHGWQDVWPFRLSFDTDASFGALHLYAGLPRPLLASVEVELPVHICTSSEVQVLTGTVHLQSPAVGTGSWVDLYSSRSQATPTRQVRVPPGRDSARFSVVVADRYEGPLTLRAAAGGVSVSVTTEIEGSLLCLESNLTLWDLIFRPAIDPAFLECPTCLLDAARNANGDTAAIVGTDLVSVDAKGVTTSWGPELAGFKPVTVHLSRWGSLAGIAVDKSGKEVSYAITDGKVSLVPDFEAAGISAYDVAFGEQYGTLATWSDGVITTYDAPGAATPVGLDNAGHLAFNYLDDMLVSHAAWHDGKTSHDLGTTGGAVVATAESLFGTIVGSATDAKGVTLPFVYTREKQQLETIALPSGFVSGEAVSVNGAGWIVGNAHGAKGEAGPFFYTANEGARLLQDLVQPGLTLQEAVQITDAGEILVWATDKSKALGLYLLTTP